MYESDSAQRRESELLSYENEGAQSLLSRESEVLIGGLASGSRKAASKSAANLVEFGDNLLNAPVPTLVDFGRQHWQEAAAGALMTVIAPRRMANAIVAAWSLKDLAKSTSDAFITALDPSKSVKETRDIFANRVAEQSESLMASLPMTLVGASAGRSGANFLFGRESAAADLLTGKLKAANWRNELLNKYERINPPSVRLVVTDMDDTLLSTQKQQALGLERAVKGLSDKTGIEEAELYKSLGKVMERYHSHSYPWTLELALKDRLKLGQPDGMSVEHFNSSIANPFWKTIDESMKDLEMMPGVRSGLDELSRQRIPVVILSDASASSGLRRLNHLGLDQKPIERLFTLKNPSQPAELPEELLQAGRERLNASLKLKHGLDEFRILPRDMEKPSPGGLLSIMELYNVRPSQVLMIGDSLRRDMGVASEAGARGLLASYKSSNQTYEEIMHRFKEENGAGRQKAVSAETQPAFESRIYSFDELSKHLNPELNSSEISRQLFAAGQIQPLFPLIKKDEPEQRR